MTDQSPLNAAMAAAATIEVAAVGTAITPPAATPFPETTLKGHPWEAAVVTGRAFAAELAKVGKDGRGWVLAEVGIAASGKAAFVLGLVVGCGGAIAGDLIGRMFGL